MTKDTPKTLIFILVLGFTLQKASSSQVLSEKAYVHANRGIAYLEQFRFQDAVREFESLVALQPDSVSAHVNLAIAYFNNREFERALPLLEKLTSLSPNSPHVHFNLGLLYKVQGRNEEAVSAFEKVLAEDRKDPMTHYYLGTLYASLGNLEQAEVHLRTAIELQPENDSAHFSLGNVLVRQGKLEEGREELEWFRELRESFPADGAAVGLKYTEQGRYAEAVEEYGTPLQQTPPETSSSTLSRWVDISDDAGLATASLPAPLATPKSVTREEYGAAFIHERLLPHLGSGLAFRDIDSDGNTDLIFIRDGRPGVFLNLGGRFEPSKDTGLPEAGEFVGLALGDVDNDLDPDLYLAGSGPNELFLNEGDGRFRAVAEAFVAGRDISVAAAFADVDHDGDLDVYVSNYLDPTPPRSRPGGDDTLRVPYDLPGAPNRLYRNNGDGSFSEVGTEIRIDGGAARSLGTLFSDFDDDRDIDFIVVNDGEPLQVFSNDRVGTFTEVSRSWSVEGTGRLRGVDATDFDQNGTVDLFLTAEGNVLNVLLRGAAGSGFRSDVLSPGLLSAGLPGGRFGTAFADVDNDTDSDLILAVSEPEILAAVYENTPTGFKRSGALKTTDPEAGAARALAVADVDNDGRLDVAIGTDRGRVFLFRNEIEGAGGWVRVRARGLRSNKDGMGAKVEVKAGGARQRREVRSVSGYLSQNDLPLHFGLGPHGAADYIRFLWPGGVKQIEMDVEGGRTVTIEELNRKGTSCPILYTWDGERIRFVTDFLGGSAIGNLLAPGLYNYPDTDEVVKLEEFPAVPRDGRFELRWVNQLEEVMMYDKAALIAIDHPSTVEVFPNERLMPSPPYPEPRVYAVRDIRSSARVFDHHGKDVTALVSEKDRTYPHSFELLPFKGYAEKHSLTLELGSLHPGEHVVLLLYGWVDYADSSSNLAAAQAGVKARPPYVEVDDGSGHFVTGLAQMGFPAGLPKTMVVDLAGIVGPERSRIRITTNMRLFWDRIQLATVVPDAELIATELRPDRAELRFRGYPAPYSPDGRAPNLYDYNRGADTELWDAHEGDYTRYGDVRTLVEEVDDMYVIARHGDELALSFDAGRLPALPSGWKRTLMVLADGFGKDMDLNSARPDTVEPLPFHGMSAYPYPKGERYPDTEAHRRYRRMFNTRRVERNRAWPPNQP